MGEDLPEQVDHINSIKTDNRWSNLRPATQQENQWNTGVRGGSYSGYKNVYWREQRKRWIVIIPTTSGNKYVGSFKDKEEANKAAIAARQQYQGEWSIDVR